MGQHRNRKRKKNIIVFYFIIFYEEKEEPNEIYPAYKFNNGRKLRV